jgi:hypothetical protein
VRHHWNVESNPDVAAPTRVAVLPDSAVEK